MANTGQKTLMSDLLEKQLVSLQSIERIATQTRLIELASAIEEKKMLDNEKTGLDDTHQIETHIEDTYYILVEIKDKLVDLGNNFKDSIDNLSSIVKGSGGTNEEKNEAVKRQEKQNDTLEKIEKVLSEGQQAKKDIKEGMSLGKIVSGIAIALGAFTGVIQAYVKNIKFWIDMLTPEILKKKFSSAVESIVKVVEGFGAKLKESFLNGIKKLSTPLEEFATKIKSIFTISEDSKTGKALEVAKKVWVGFKEGVTKFLEPFIDAFKFIGEFFKGPEVKAAEESKSIFTTIGENLGKFGKMFSAVAKIVSKILLPLTIVMTVWDTVKGAIEGYEQEGIIGAIEGAVTGLFNSLIGGTFELLKRMSSWVLEQLGFDKAAEYLDSFSFEDMAADFIDALMHPVDTIKTMINSLQISLVEGINSLIEKWNSSVPDALKIGKLDVPKKYESEREGNRPSDKKKQEKVKAENELLNKPESDLTDSERKDRAEIIKKRSAEGQNNVVEKPVKETEEEKKKRYYDIYVKKGPQAMHEAMDADIRAKPESERTEEEKKQLDYNDMLSGKKPGLNVKQVPPTSADVVATKTTETNAAKEDAQSTSGTTIISSPVVNNSSNNVQNQSVRLPARSQDMTFGRYVMSRFAVN